MRVLVDTHAFLWALLEDPRLSADAQQILTAESSELVFSLASLWEISIKIKLGKLHALGSSVAYVRDEMKEYGMEFLPIRFEHILRLEMLPQHHGDPFDRLLIAQASTEGIPILTHDKRFSEYDVNPLW